jgi:predicted HicB family RNase H-like nuclease
MKNVLEYNGYKARIDFEPEDDCFVGHIAGIRDIVGFHATTLKELKKAFRFAVDDYIETCAKAGKSPEKPFSGKVMFRINPEVHAKAALAAQMEGLSLNQWAEKVMEKAAQD